MPGPCFGGEPLDLRQPLPRGREDLVALPARSILGVLLLGCPEGGARIETDLGLEVVSSGGEGHLEGFDAGTRQLEPEP